jgi:hypothetical protein
MLRRLSDADIEFRVAHAFDDQGGRRSRRRRVEEQRAHLKTNNLRTTITPLNVTFNNNWHHLSRDESRPNIRAILLYREQRPQSRERYPPKMITKRDCSGQSILLNRLLSRKKDDQETTNNIAAARLLGWTETNGHTACAQNTHDGIRSGTVYSYNPIKTLKIHRIETPILKRPRR